MKLHCVTQYTNSNEKWASQIVFGLFVKCAYAVIVTFVYTKIE